MSRRRKRRLRRDWRSGWGRRLILLVGWLALLSAVAGLVLFAATARPELLGAGAGAALLAFASSGVMPEPRPKHRAAVFAPLEHLRVARRRPSLARQLLTLP